MALPTDVNLVVVESWVYTNQTDTYLHVVFGKSSEFLDLANEAARGIPGAEILREQMTEKGDIFVQFSVPVTKLFGALVSVIS